MNKQTDAFPIPPRTRRTTFSLPTETLDRIERLSQRFGVSQSAFVAELLDQPLAGMASIMDALPESGITAQDVKRARGRSIGLIKGVIGEALEAVATLGTGHGRADSKAAGRGPTQPVRASKVRQKAGSPGKSAAANNSGSGLRAPQRPVRGIRASGGTTPPSRPRKTSGAAVNGVRRQRGTTKR